MVKLILALVHAVRRLQRYYQAHPIKVLTDKPNKQILARPEKSGRIAKWAIELGEHDIEFKERNSIKGQILADILAETPSIENKDMETRKPTATNKVLNLERIWKLFTDRASSSDGSGTGLMLVSPEGKEYTLKKSYKKYTKVPTGLMQSLTPWLQKLQSKVTIIHQCIGRRRRQYKDVHVSGLTRQYVPGQDEASR
ncbi:reverse transcriptase domain-containing protein, partial [Tanacetum coccineum]